MKYFITIFVGLFSFCVFSQEVLHNTSLEKEGDLIKYVEYHTNGVVAQMGYIKDGLNHGTWSAFDTQGTKIMEGQYLKGIKTSKWFFWNDESLVEVNFENNKIVKAIRWDKSRILAENAKGIL